ncbi:MAG: peptide ABC transporter substrate-binding protein, partial [Alphaproteobacteria bacterium]|nr:peptide ABC transporter substrate-binding protein [Alphaproteobacteria bacterium]
DDANVRRALNLSIDKAQLIARVTRGGQVPATHYVPDITGSGYSAQAELDRKAGRDPFSGPDFDFDPVRARALLREAGYEIAEEGGNYKAKGFPPLEILYNTSEGHRAIAIVIQDAWQRNLGVTVSLRNEEWKVMLKSRDQGNFQIMRGGFSAEYNHPLTFLDTFLSYSPQNESGWADPEYDRLVKEGVATADPAESIRKLRLAERRAALAVPRIPLYFYTKGTLVKPWVKGFYPNARNVHLMQWLWIDETNSAENRPAAEPREYPPPGRFAKGPAPTEAP